MDYLAFPCLCRACPCCRFPFISCEVFTCEIDQIMQTVVDEPEVRDRRNTVTLTLSLCVTHMLTLSLCCLGVLGALWSEVPCGRGCQEVGSLQAPL